MSHALLLRLFLSPYFSISVAMHYLKTYPDSIGISHYLCWRMKGMKTDEVEFYWPQICHLLVTRPSQSNALECFVLERAEESTHSAMLTFWFMQTALRDLSATRQSNPRPFQICQRVLHRCHEIIFGDPPEPSTSPYRSQPTTPPISTVVLGANSKKLGSNSASTANKNGGKSAGLLNRWASTSTSVYRSTQRKKQKVNPHLSPALVGLGVVLASAPGMPKIAEHSGQVAIMQGRRPWDEMEDSRKRVEVDRGGADVPRFYAENEVVPRVSVSGEDKEGNTTSTSADDSDLEDWQARQRQGGAASKSVIDLSDPIGSRSPHSLGQSSSRREPRVDASPRKILVGGQGQAHGSLHSPPQSPTHSSSGDLSGSPDSKRVLGAAALALDPSKKKSLRQQPLHPSHTSPSLLQTARLQSSVDVPIRTSSRQGRTPPRDTGIKSSDSKNGPADGGRSASPSSGSPKAKGPRRLSSGRGGGHQAAFYSVPAFPTSKPHTQTVLALMPSAESLLATYDLDAQRQLLRSHYCRSEFRFLQTLEDISNRLLVIPKPARVSALRAELTSLNHNLPAEVCMPMWCPADHSHEEGGETTGGSALNFRPDKQPNARVRSHHRVVRISPGDSVVLNSAERAPYLLHLEILEDDLDFDPSKRANRELLKKIVVQIERKKRKREGIETIEYSPASLGSNREDRDFTLEKTKSHVPQPSPRKRSSLTHLDQVRMRSPSSTGSTTPPTNGRKDSASEAPEEMDLVEQLFGSNFSLRDQPPDLSELIPINLAPQNKQSDAMTWSKIGEPDRAPSAIQTPAMSPGTKATEFPGFADRRASAQAITPVGDMSPGPLTPAIASTPSHKSERPVITLEDYSDRMRTAAVMLAQLNASMQPERPKNTNPDPSPGGPLKWIPGTGWIMGTNSHQSIEFGTPPTSASASVKLQTGEAEAIRQRIMAEMMSLEEERVSRMTSKPEGVTVQPSAVNDKTAEDESIIRRELNKADPSAVVFSESWATKQSRIRAASPWGHLAAWNVLSVIVKTGTDLRQEQLATQLIELFSKIWKEENCDCWARFFRILITGEQSGLVETITDAVSIHSIKKAEYARRMTKGNLGNVSLMDHFVNTYGSPDSGRYARAQRNFIKSLAGYSVITFLLQIKDRHNGNILIDRDGHLIHIDFGFMLSNSPGGNMGFEAAPFKLPMEYVDIMGGLDSPGFDMFKKLFKEGFEAARKHSDSIVTIVELMQKDSKLDCFVMFGEHTAQQLKERFQLGLPQAAVDAYLERLVVSSIGSNWTRLYDSFQYYSQGVL